MYLEEKGYRRISYRRIRLLPDIFSSPQFVKIFHWFNKTTIFSHFLNVKVWANLRPTKYQYSYPKNKGNKYCMIVGRRYFVYLFRETEGVYCHKTWIISAKLYTPIEVYKNWRAFTETYRTLSFQILRVTLDRRSLWVSY